METTNLSFRRRTLGSMLRRVEEVLRSRVFAQLAEAGYPDIRPAHSSLFRNIAEKGSRVSELAERAQMTKQSMGYLAESLLAAGYLSLEPDETDRRAKLVKLTKKGLAAGETMVRLSAGVEREFAELIGKTEMVQLRRLVEQLADKLL